MAEFGMCAESGVEFEISHLGEGLAFDIVTACGTVTLKARLTRGEAHVLAQELALAAIKVNEGR